MLNAGCEEQHEGELVAEHAEPIQRMRGVCAIAGATALFLLCGDLILRSLPVPAGGPVAGGVVALVLVLGARYLRRLTCAPRTRPAVRVADISDVQVTDLLGRRQVDTDLDTVAGYLTGKRVLVTGAGGSIGSELCRQIHRYAPAELMMLDRDESALHAVQLSLDRRARLDSPSVILADLRDAATIQTIFEVRRPQVVFHAAALKHLSLLERFPGEAVRTNIWGTLNVLEAATEVERFVNISTDKAANPCSVLGFSKRIAERLTAQRAATSGAAFLSVRFGNVLGSRGSVLTTFCAQIAAGGPMVVTHPEVTRYLMTIQEAVQLVIQGAAIGRGGEALILQMGKPVRIAEVARRLAQLKDVPVDIEYSALRPGEKLHEELFGADELDLRPLHPLISHVRVPPLDPQDVLLLDSHGRPDDLIARLRVLCRPVRGGASGSPRRGSEGRCAETRLGALLIGGSEVHPDQELREVPTAPNLSGPA
jgi:FlaA1/EpsC-like NDP-sugar epimerase